MVKNINDFVETIRVVDILGRRAHDVRYNLWYDCDGRVLYSTGHVLAVLASPHAQNGETSNVNANQYQYNQYRIRTQ